MKNDVKTYQKIINADVIVTVVVVVDELVS